MRKAFPCHDVIMVFFLFSEPQEGQLRCGEHSDYGSITLLFQDNIGGLEVIKHNRACQPGGHHWYYLPGVKSLQPIGRSRFEYLTSWSSGLQNPLEIRYRIRHLIVRSRKVSKARDRWWHFSNCSVIWQASRQHCCRGAGQISKQYVHFNTQSYAFETISIDKMSYAILNRSLIARHGTRIIVPALAAKRHVLLW